MNGPITIRIGRLVVEGASRDEAGLVAAALRSELAQRIAERGGLPPGWRGPAPGREPQTLRAVTPGGRGREAAGRLLGR